MISNTGKLSRFIKEIQGHMRLRSSGDRHEIRQQYFSLLWYRLIKQLQTSGKDIIPDIIDLMDSYYLTKDDWDAMLELGVGPLEMEDKAIDTQTRAAFTRAYNMASHPLPYMKASQVVAPKKKDRERPDLEEALEASDSGGESGDDQVVVSGEEELDLKKDKYVKAPKKRKAAAAAAAGGKAKAGKSDAAKGPAKGRGKKVKDEGEDEEMEVDDDDVSEDAFEKPKKGRGGKGAGRGRPKKT